LAPFSILFQPYLDKIDESQSVVRGLAEMATMQRTKGMLPSAGSEIAVAYSLRAGNSEDFGRMRDLLHDIQSQMTPLKKLDSECSGS
jgi:hypothetical protein